MRNSDTGLWTFRVRPHDEWVYAEAPQLRIVPDDLWNAVQRHREEQRKLTRGQVTARKPKYLFWPADVRGVRPTLCASNERHEWWLLLRTRYQHEPRPGDMPE